MNIIYSGGWDHTQQTSIQSSFVVTYAQYIKTQLKTDKKVAFITLAKADGHYDPFIKSLYNDDVDIINSKAESIQWDSYNAIFNPGGDPKQLKESLEKIGFSLGALHPEVTILGDSAGSYVLSSYFYKSPPGENRGKIIDFIEGFNPDANLITIAHTNNKEYYNDILLKKVQSFAKQKNLKINFLAENEQKLLKDEILVPIKPNDLVNM